MYSPITSAALVSGVIGDHVALQPVRLQAVLSPDALHGGQRHVAQPFGQLTCAIQTARTEAKQGLRRAKLDKQ